jgi:hypothetical protein
MMLDGLKVLRLHTVSFSSAIRLDVGATSFPSDILELGRLRR